MDIFDLAKKAKIKKSESEPQKELENKLVRLDRKFNREKMARVQAEEAIEEISRNLYLANQEINSSNQELVKLNEELSSTMSKLTSAELRRKSIIITLIVAGLLFIISEFAIEPVLEKEIDNKIILILLKLLILGMLVPIEIMVSKILESNISKDDEINESMYQKILEAAYEDGIITDMERSVLRSSAKQLGISKNRAVELEEIYL